MIYGGLKLLAAAGGSGIVAVALSETTQVPIGWLIGGCFAIAGGAFAAGVSLQSVKDRIVRLEQAVKRLEKLGENTEAGSKSEE